jgi:hypothetical protein
VVKSEISMIRHPKWNLCHDQKFKSVQAKTKANGPFIESVSVIP